MHAAVTLLRAEGRLLLRHDGDHWTVPTTPVGDDRPLAVARETARDIVTAPTPVRVGESLQWSGEGPDTLTPVLFDCTRQDVTDGEWIHVPEVRRRETPPWLWAAYDRVRPTVDAIVEDRDHGASWLSVRALEVLRDEATLSDDPATIKPVGTELRNARPNMTPLRTRISRAMAAPEGDDPTTTDYERAASEAIDRAVVADSEAAATAATLDADHVVTLSRSGTVRRAIEALDPQEVLIAASRPGGEGVEVAADLAATTDVTLTSDAGLPAAVADTDPDVALVGADTVTPEGHLRNKVGTRGLALAADREGVPLYAVTATAKVGRRTESVVESAGELAAVAPDGVDTRDPLFDLTPAALLSGYCTEEGIVDPDDIGRFAPE